MSKYDRNKSGTKTAPNFWCHFYSMISNVYFSTCYNLKGLKVKPDGVAPNGWCRLVLKSLQVIENKGKTWHQMFGAVLVPFIEIARLEDTK